MLLYFPSMHAELASPGLPEEVRFLDPGLAGEDDARFRPDGLPLDPRAARAFADESLRFGEQFGKIKDISFFAAGRMENFFDQTSMAIHAELRARLKGADQPLEPAARARAQGLLLLAHDLEKRHLEAIAHQHGAQSGRLKLAAALGLDDEDAEELWELGLQDEGEDAAEPAPLSESWRVVFEAMLLLAGKVDFYTDDPQTLADLEDLGLLSSSAAGRMARAPAWKLLGLKKADARRPWLDSEVVVRAPAALVTT